MSIITNKVKEKYQHKWDEQESWNVSMTWTQIEFNVTDSRIDDKPFKKLNIDIEETSKATYEKLEEYATWMNSLGIWKEAEVMQS